MIIPDQSLEAYLGSRHSALGLVLAWLGLLAIGLGLMGLAAPDEIPQWVSIVLVIWGGSRVSSWFGHASQKTTSPTLGHGQRVALANRAHPNVFDFGKIL